jgi:hypothetical protein
MPRPRVARCRHTRAIRRMFPAWASWKRTSSSSTGGATKGGAVPSAGAWSAAAARSGRAVDPSRSTGAACRSAWAGRRWHRTSRPLRWIVCRGPAETMMMGMPAVCRHRAQPAGRFQAVHHRHHGVHQIRSGRSVWASSSRSGVVGTRTLESERPQHVEQGHAVGRHIVDHQHPAPRPAWPVTMRARCRHRRLRAATLSTAAPARSESSCPGRRRCRPGSRCP